MPTVDLDTFKRELKAWLGAKPTILATLGDRPRVYYLRAPAGVEEPYATWRLWAEGHHHLTGVAAIESPLVTVDVYGKDEGAVGAAAKALDDELNGYRGLMGQVNVRACHRQSWQTIGEPRAAGTDDTVAHERLDFGFWIARSS